eukprot:2649146-Alexandrium_andersonii.AAC.1
MPLRPHGVAIAHDGLQATPQRAVVARELVRVLPQHDDGVLRDGSILLEPRDLGWVQALEK